MIIDSDQSNPHEEPCLQCGEETAIGSVFYSDRHEGTMPDGRRAFLCSECQKPLRAKQRSVDISDPDVYMAILAGAQFTFRDSSF